MGNGKTTRLMVLELILILMERVTKVNGLKINNMVKVMKHGLMEPVTEVCILKEKNTEKVSSLGLTNPHMMVLLMKTILKVLESMFGTMVVSIRATGSTIKWKEKVSLTGQMVENMKAITKTTKKKV
jgi:uncharacterized protein (UPF0261 family)